MTMALRRGCDEFPGLVGRQEPEWALRSEGLDFHHGVECVKLFEWATRNSGADGVRLFPWQVDEIMQAFACDADGRWTHKDMAIICPRQNGKTLIFEAALLYRLFGLNQQIIFTAQQWKTGQSIRNRLWRRIKSEKKLTSRIVRNVNSLGSAEIALDSGAKVQFSTRSVDTGRGFDKLDLLIIDEAYNLDDADMDALLPIQAKASDPQTIYLSTPVNRDIHTFGVKLSELRGNVRRGLPSGWAWSEYAAPDGADRDAEATWAMANPSLRGGSEMDVIRKLHGSMSSTGFDAEILGWGRWFADEADRELIVSREVWAELAGSPSLPGDSCLGVDSTPDGKLVGLVAAQRDGDGFFLSVAPGDAFDRQRVVDAVSRSVEANDSLAVVMDKDGPCSTLVDPLADVGVEVDTASGGNVSAAYELLIRLVAEGRVKHDGDPRWLDAWDVAVERSNRGKYRSFDRFAGNVQILVAASLAVWGLHEFAIPEQTPDVEIKRRFAVSPVAVPGDSLAAMSF